MISRPMPYISSLCINATSNRPVSLLRVMDFLATPVSPYMYEEFSDQNTMIHTCAVGLIIRSNNKLALATIELARRQTIGTGYPLNRYIVCHVS
jgi:hypothetical protein